MTYDMRSSTYRDVDVLSSTPEQLLPLLYNHLLVNLRRASLCIKRGDIQGKFDSICKAADIIAELRGFYRPPTGPRPHTSPMHVCSEAVPILGKEALSSNFQARSKAKFPGFSCRYTL